MAKKKPSPRSQPKPKAQPADALCIAALALAERRNWGLISLDDVAAGAKIAPQDAKKIFRDKAELMAGIINWVTSQMIESVGAFDSRSDPHDRLFETLMARFDILQGHRRAILSLMDAAKLDPRAALRLLPAEANAMRAVIKCTSLPVPPLPEPILVAGLLGIYGLGLCAWRRDQSDDMTKTMAALDRLLRQSGKLMGLLTRHNYKL